MRVSHILGFIGLFGFVGIGCVEQQQRSRADIMRELDAKTEAAFDEQMRKASQTNHTPVIDDEYLNRYRNWELDNQRRKTEVDCFSRCLYYSGIRQKKHERLLVVRDYVRDHCRTEGTQNQGRTDKVITSEDSPTAHNRIVENEGSGKLEYRERRIDVVEIRPSWNCGKDESSEVKEVAKNYMYELPRELMWVGSCNQVKNDHSMRDVSAEVCDGWARGSLQLNDGENITK